MLIEGILEVTKDKYALLRTTKKAEAVLRGECAVIVKELKKKPVYESDNENRMNAAVAGTSKKRISDILNSRGLKLFDQLRSLRIAIAKEESVPPYIIFSDKTLVDMCVKVPFNKEEMLRVNGVGENKFERYGERFIQEIHEFTSGVKEKFYFGEWEELQADTGKVQGFGEAKNGKAKTPKSDFYLTKEQAEKFPYAEKYLAAELAEKLNDLRDTETVKKTSGAEIFRKVQEEEYAKEEYVNGMWKKSVSAAGEAAGLYIGMRTSKKGTEYEDIYYYENAQRMIVGWVTK